MPAAPVPLGAFLLSEPIGRGGMGVVRRAVHAAGGVPVAVKVLTERKARSPRFQASFRNEVRAVAGLSHPHVVRVFDHGEVDADAERRSGGALIAGSPYLVMELAPRGSLETLAGALAPAELRAVLLALLDALAHAHARGVVHLDLKPQNVLQGATGGARSGVKLSDFGLAHALDGDDRDEGPVTVAGTPSFMAPEQLEGRVRDFGPWTNLFALGRLALSLGGAGGTPPAWRAWLERLLATDPADRFQRAADAAWALASLPDEGRASGGAGPMPAGDTTCASLGSMVVTAATRPVLAAAEPAAPAAHRGAPLATPPMPASFRGADEGAIAPELLGVGLGLYGLRAVPLIDRDAERAVIWGRLSEVERSASPRACVLVGAAGNGKSRLAEWICERAHETGAASVLRAAHGMIAGPADGLAGMVRRALRAGGLHGEALLDRAERVLRRQGVDDPYEWRALAELVEPEASASTDGRERVRLTGATERHVLVARLVARLARERPAVVWLDDVQWGTDALAFARHLVEAEPGPVLLLLTARSEALAERPIAARQLAELAGERITVVPIEPLPRADHEALVVGLLALDGALAARVADRTSGNPLFAVQLVGDWVQRALLEVGERGFQLKAGAPDDLPADLDEVWRQRIARLLVDRPAADGIALEMAAVLGQEVDAAEWREVCARAGAVPSGDLVEALLAQRLATPAERGPGQGFAFVHGMLRESLERTAEREGRLAAHHRACAALVAGQGAGDALAAERLGRHLLAAGDWTGALAPLTRGAGARLAEGEHRAAEGLLGSRDRAMAALALPDGDPRRTEGLLLRAQLERGQARYLEARRLTAEVRDAARRHGARELDARAMLEEAELARLLGDPGLALERLREAEGALAALSAPRLLAQCRIDIGRVLLNRPGGLDEAAAALDQALSHGEAARDEETAARSLLYRGEVDRQAGRFDEAARRFHEARRRFAAAGLAHGVALSDNVLGDLARYRGDGGGAEAHYRAALARLRAVGSGHALQVEVNLGLVLLEQGSFAAGGPILEACLAAFERRGVRAMSGAMHCCLLACAASERDRPRWERHAGAAERLLAETGFVDLDNARALERAALLAAAAGWPDAARRADTLALAQWTALDRAAEAAAVRDRLASDAESRDRARGTV